MDAPSLHDAALQKIRRIFGSERGQRLADEILDNLGIAVILTADDLRGFATRLALLGTFEGAVAAMLRVHAVMSEAKAS